MVEAPKRTGSPVLGEASSRAASFSISLRSVPFVGGAANNWPITEKRNRAHRSWARELCLSVTPALPPHMQRATVENAPTADEERLLRVGEARHAACTPFSPVIGNSKRRPAMSCSAAAPEKRSSSEAGRRSWSTGGMKAAETPRQHGLATKARRHHARQRAIVRRPTPTSSQRCRAAVAPCRIAETSTTTAPSETLRPSNRNDGRVLRLRQRSEAQQKLNP